MTTEGGKNWGRWGEDDELGALNLIGPADVLAALQIPREGKLYSLAQSLQSSGVPMRLDMSAPSHEMAIEDGRADDLPEERYGAGMAQDAVTVNVHGNTTHIDALGHLWCGDRLYNGFSSDSVRDSGMERCGIENVPGIVGRGVLLDVAGADGIPPGQVIGADDLEACARRQGTVPRRGDSVLIRTGAYDRYLHEPAGYGEAWAGIGLEGAEWLADKEVTLVGADNLAVEACPYPDGTWAPVHQRLLCELGIYLIELMYLEDLAADGRWEFLFIVLPLRLHGGTGSPVNPIAVV